jgi:hypothetical protein
VSAGPWMVFLHAPPGATHSFSASRTPSKATFSAYIILIMTILSGIFVLRSPHNIKRNHS